MFNDKSKKADKSTVRYDTLISTKTSVTGDITVTGGLHIDGEVKGNLMADLDSNATIRISESGHVTGQISAPNIIINGSVQGDVLASGYLELAGKARIKGDVHYERMEMVLGAQINGQIHHRQTPDSQPVAVDGALTKKKPVEGTKASPSKRSPVMSESITPVTGQ